MNRLICGLVLVGLSLVASRAMAEPQCGDLLAKLSEKPEVVEFLECTKNKEEQGKPIVARYRVKGSEALEAERYMSRSFRQPKLQYICCGWDSTIYSYRDEATQRWYTLGMGSEETPVNQRDSWSKITYFYITASITTEDF
ncbi:hypothetical protein cym2001_41130 [Pseudomonas sp. CYM-20-01]|uniref:DUF4952 domain-containing protein n=1 Tax=Pseudomonas sp. CYM-20-01 TaxID=2870750 RepID=UPI00204936A2|nr:DUF4952 domain-containing protein [Pseudomonas sp. CYM-20-01]BDB20748.1 hypothetical protein cym2001_41130 [Pseudomonas sp. CYM-20-01]